MTIKVHICVFQMFSCVRTRIPENREAALSNLNNFHRIIFCDDPDGIFETYVRQIKAGELKIDATVPDEVLDLVKTATPADFNNSPHLAWRYVIRKGWIWQIDEASDDYTPQSEGEAVVLNLVAPEHPAQMRNIK